MEDCLIATSLSKSFLKMRDIPTEISNTNETPDNMRDTSDDLDTSNVMMKSFFNNQDLIKMSVDIKHNINQTEQQEV